MRPPSSGSPALPQPRAGRNLDSPLDKVATHIIPQFLLLVLRDLEILGLHLYGRVGRSLTVPLLHPYLALTQLTQPCTYGDLDSAVVGVSLPPSLAPELLRRHLTVSWISLCHGCMLSLQLQLQHPVL